MTPFDAMTISFEELQSKTLAPVTVAVVDSGVDATHPDLLGRVARAFSVDDSAGTLTVVERQVPCLNDVVGHGTAAAGIIAGIAPNAMILDIRVLNAENVGRGDALVEGFRFAMESDAKIINLSLASTARFAEPLSRLCEQCYRLNKLVVAAKRNLVIVDNGFPAEFSSCISVDCGSFDNWLDIRFRPKSGPIEFMGRGEEVRVPSPGGTYSITTGTSYATPAVSGLCALLVGAYGDLLPFEAKALLKSADRSRVRTERDLASHSI